MVLKLPAQVLLALLLSLLIGPIYSQVLTPEGAALGEAIVAREHIWGGGANPASSHEGEQSWGLQAYGTTPLDPGQLSRFGLDFSLRNKSRTTHFEAGLQHFAPPGYGISAFRLGASRRLAEGLELGLRVGVVTADYDEYGSEILPIAELGMLYQIAPSVKAGAHFSYSNRSVLPLAQQRLRIAIDYASSSKLHILLGATQAVSEPLSANVGLDYSPAEKLRLMLGYRSLGQNITLGSSFRLANSVSLQLAFGIYAQLPVHGHYGVGI